MSIKDKIDDIFAVPTQLFGESGTLAAPTPATGKGGDGTTAGIAIHKTPLGDEEELEKEEEEKNKKAKEEKK